MSSAWLLSHVKLVIAGLLIQNLLNPNGLVGLVVLSAALNIFHFYSTIPNPPISSCIPITAILPFYDNLTISMTCFTLIVSILISHFWCPSEMIFFCCIHVYIMRILFYYSWCHSTFRIILVALWVRSLEARSWGVRKHEGLGKKFRSATLSACIAQPRRIVYIRSTPSISSKSKFCLSLYFINTPPRPAYTTMA